MSALPGLVLGNLTPGAVPEIARPGGMAWYEHMQALVAELDARLRKTEERLMCKVDIWDIR